MKTLVLAVAMLSLAACSNPSAKPAEEKSSLATNKETMKKVFTMFESGNYDGIENCVAENMVEHNPPQGIKSTGIQMLKDVIKMHHDAFPDTKITVLNMWAEGDMVCAHFNMKGTNTGAMGEMPATNKTMDVNGVDIVRFENGKGVEHWGYWEETKMMMQLGMMPEQGAKMDSTQHSGTH